MKPVVDMTGFITISSSAVARMKRSEIRERSTSLNAAPGLRFAPSGLRKKERKEEKEAERRKTLFRNRRSLAGCGAAPTLTLPRKRGRKKEGAARLPAFHGGSCPRDSRIPRLNSDQASRDTAPKAAGFTPPAPAPLAASTSRAGHVAGRHDVRAAREQR